MVMGMLKNCDNCIYSGRPSYKYPCTVCETAYGSAPSKLESIVLYTADMVEVVRCKDCQKWYRHTEVDRERGECRRYQTTKHETGYCDRGERKDNG